MSDINDGGPAFPGANPKYDDNWDKRVTVGGISIRDYFAAKAPANPLWTFEPKMESARPEAFSYQGGARTSAEIDANKLACAAWDQEARRQLFIQWPWVWADAMLKARATEPT